MASELTPRDRRLSAELDHLRELECDSSFFHLELVGDPFPPEEYKVTFTCRGLIRKPEPALPWEQCIGESHKMHVYLPADYPLQPPQICLETPIFHPNIKYLEDWARDIEEQLGGPDNMRRALQLRPELREEIRLARSRLICLDGIRSPRERGNYVPRVRLYDICRELGEMIMFQLYNLDDPLDEGAWRWTLWAQKQTGLLPIDRRVFLDRLQLKDVPITVLGATTSG